MNFATYRMVHCQISMKYILS